MFIMCRCCISLSYIFFVVVRYGKNCFFLFRCTRGLLYCSTRKSKQRFLEKGFVRWRYVACENMFNACVHLKMRWTSVKWGKVSYTYVYVYLETLICCIRYAYLCIQYTYYIYKVKLFELFESCGRMWIRLNPQRFFQVIRIIFYRN